MRTVCLPTVHVSLVTTRCQYHCGGKGGVGPQVNKFEQVSMVTTRCHWWGGGMSRWLGGCNYAQGAYVRGWVAPTCYLSHDVCDVASPREQTHTCENIAFPQLPLRAVKTIQTVIAIEIA